MILKVFDAEKLGFYVAKIISFFILVGGLHNMTFVTNEDRILKF